MNNLSCINLGNDITFRIIIFHSNRKLAILDHVVLETIFLIEFHCILIFLCKSTSKSNENKIRKLVLVPRKEQNIIEV